MAPKVVQGKPLVVINNDDVGLAVEDESGQSPEYIYDSLPGADFIRILELMPGDDKSDLKCIINPLCLDESSLYPYRAVSYTWQEAGYENLTISGSRVAFPGPRKEYSIRHPIWCHGRRILISTNLRDALRRFRNPSVSIRLWIDAVCINQEDLEERSRQVLLMPRIYHGALNVWFWMGESDEDSQMALEWIGDINKSRASYAHEAELSRQLSRFDIRDSGTMERIGLRPIESACWNSLVNFLKRPVFQRIWIVQELVTGKLILSHCGETVLDYSEIRSAVDFITQCSWDSELSEYYCKGNNIFRCIDVIKHIDKEWYQNRYNVRLQLMLATRNFLSSDPRDKVYALMGLFNDFAHRESDHLHHGGDYERPMDALSKEFDFITLDRKKEGVFHNFATTVTRAIRELVIHQADIEMRQSEERDAQLLRESTNEVIVDLRARLVEHLCHGVPAIIESTRPDRPCLSEDDGSQDVEPLMRSLGQLRAPTPDTLIRNMKTIESSIKAVEDNERIRGFAEHVMGSVHMGVWRVQQFQGIGDAVVEYMRAVRSLEADLRHFLELLGHTLPSLFPSPPPPPPPTSALVEAIINTPSDPDAAYYSSDDSISHSVYSITFPGVESGNEFCGTSHWCRTQHDPGEFCCSYMAGHDVISCSSYDEEYFLSALDSLANSTLPPYWRCHFDEDSWRLLKALFGDLSEWERGPKVVAKGSIQIGEDGMELNPDPNHWSMLDKKWLREDFFIPVEKPDVGRVNKAPLQHWCWSPSISRMPDYHLSVEEVFREFTLRCLMDDPRLIILSTVDDPSRKEHERLPSWVPDFSVPLSRSILLFPELDIEIPYATGRKEPTQVTWSSEHPEDLHIQGYRFDSVEYVSEMKASDNLLSVIGHAIKLLKIQAEDIPRDGKKIQELSLTLIANCSAGPAYEYPASPTFVKDFEDFVELGDIAADIERDTTSRPEMFNTAGLYLDAVKRIMKQRRFFVTKQGHYGVGPWSTKAGDIVVVFRGGPLPFIIRGRHDSGSEATEQVEYQLVGESYCHGICEGQVLDLVGFAWEDILLR